MSKIFERLVHHHVYTVNYLVFPVASEIIASVTSTLNSCLGALELLMHSTADLSRLKESLAVSQPITVL